MCGISGIYNMKHLNILNLNKYLKIMNKLLLHRGPDFNDVWENNEKYIGFGHTRLSIIDLDVRSSQPMNKNGYVLTFNGEIYNYKELKEQIRDKWSFTTESDTEIIMAYYHIYKEECTKYLEGMFSFSIYDTKNNVLFCARDQLGIKPFYYLIQDDIFYFASEVKALIPFLKTEELEVNKDALTEYLLFQYPISNNTMINNIKQLLPGNNIIIKNNNLTINKYWSLNYKKQDTLSLEEQSKNVRNLLERSIKLHLNSDVPISSYSSGGVDSSIVSLLANKEKTLNYLFHGKFSEYPNCDESKYSKIVSNKTNIELIEKDITSQDFENNIRKIIYHMDYPSAGPGVFPQYMISKEVSKYSKVVLGGQGGDEIFCGYVRYIIPYLEHSLSDALNGNGEKLANLIPSMPVMKNYKPMLKKYLKKDVFENLDKRYFCLCDRSDDLNKIINWDNLNKDNIKKKFLDKFNYKCINDEDIFNKMLHFDLENSLQGLLHVEDRVSMAWGVESRVPLLNHILIEYLASIPEKNKINPSNMKFLLKKSCLDILPEEILNRKDKMGFPVPINDWIKNNELNVFFKNLMSSLKNRDLPFLKISDNLLNELNSETFTREYWILLNIELWYQEFYDKFKTFKNMLD